MSLEMCASKEPPGRNTAWLSWSAWAARTSSRRSCGLKNKQFLLAGLEAGKSKIRVPADLVSGDGPPPGLQVVTFLLYLHMAESSVLFMPLEGHQSHHGSRHPLPHPNLITLQRLPLYIPSTLGIRVWTCGFGRNASIQSVALAYRFLGLISPCQELRRGRSHATRRLRNLRNCELWNGLWSH